MKSNRPILYSFTPGVGPRFFAQTATAASVYLCSVYTERRSDPQLPDYIHKLSCLPVPCDTDVPSRWCHSVEALRNWWRCIFISVLWKDDLAAHWLFVTGAGDKWRLKQVTHSAAALIEQLLQSLKIAKFLRQLVDIKIVHLYNVDIWYVL